MILRRLFPIVAVVSIAIGTLVATDATPVAASSTLTWAIAPSPNTSSTQNNDLSAVSCTSPTACVSVGAFNNGTNDQTLVETWNGTTWSITPSPNTSPTQNNNLNAVSCPSPKTCVAVGYSYDGTRFRTLIETWDGTAWTITSSPDTSSTMHDILNGVSCTSSSACVAVGRYESDTNERTLIETWDGTAWSIAVSPNASTTMPNVLESVSCTSPRACTSVGYYSDGSNDLTLVEAWDGTAWSITPSPNPSTSQSNYLAGVSCSSPAACAAAGVSNNGTNDQTLILSAVSPGGYRLVASDGGVFAYGAAAFFGSAAAIHLNQPVVGMAATHDGDGYWLVASDGGVFAYGDATFYGSAGAIHLNQPIVGMAATRDGNGYWLVASDGGVFAYGDAVFYGSTGGSVLNKPVVGMAATQDGNGYWLVASDGGVFAYGDATFEGSGGGQTLVKPMVGMASSPIGNGYWLVASDGGIFSYGDAPFLGSTGGQALTHPIVGLTADQSGHGYWLASSSGGVFAFGDAPALGSQAGLTLTHPIVGIAD